MAGPLSGVRVVEAANYLSGPYAAMMLGDLGAEVVKVEGPRGDPYRRFGRPSTPFSALFAAVNRGKQSVVLDLKTPEGHGHMLDLLDQADVLVCNWRPAVAARLGLADDLLAARNPRLIRTYVSGYGVDGPMADAPAFDTVIQGRSGMTTALRRDDEPVVSAGYPVDKMTSVMVAQAVLAALVARARTGEGERVDVSMLDSVSYLNLPDLLVNRVFVDTAPADPRNRHGLALRPLRCRDGWIVVAPASAAAIRSACEALGHPEWSEEVLAVPDHAGMVEAILERMGRVTPILSAEEVLGKLQAHDVAAAPCLEIDQHLDDAQVEHNAIYRVAEEPGLGRVRSVRYPALFSTWGEQWSSAGAPPLGRDTESVESGQGRPTA